MASLYELTGDYLALAQMIDNAEDDSQIDELLTRFDELQDRIADKADAYAKLIRNKTAEAEAYKAEADRLMARKRAAERVVEGLKDRLTESMKQVGADRITTSIGEWRFQQSPPSVRIIDENEIPAEWKIPQPDKVDKASILKWYKESGEILPGTDIERGTSLRFR